MSKINLKELFNYIQIINKAIREGKSISDIVKKYNIKLGTPI